MLSGLMGLALGGFLLVTPGPAQTTVGSGGTTPPTVRPGAPGQPSQTLSAAEAGQVQFPLQTEADVRFMQDMIHHHLQAVEMAGMVVERTENPDLRLLARKIEASPANGILLDIRNPNNLIRVDEVIDTNFAYWHSATFNDDGTTEIFTDEWGGGTSPGCRDTDPAEWGANAFFRIENGKMTFAGYYELPVPQTAQENCVAHNGSLIPVPGRDIKVQARYQGGLSIVGFTDPANAYEIAYFDRGPLSETQLQVGGFWSTYCYNGYIYGSEIARGLDVCRLAPSEHLTQNESGAADAAQRTQLFGILARYEAGGAQRAAALRMLTEAANQVRQVGESARGEEVTPESNLRRAGYPTGLRNNPLVLRGENKRASDATGCVGRPFFFLTPVLVGVGKGASCSDRLLRLDGPR